MFVSSSPLNITLADQTTNVSKFDELISQNMAFARTTQATDYNYSKGASADQKLNALNLPDTWKGTLDFASPYYADFLEKSPIAQQAYEAFTADLAHKTPETLTSEEHQRASQLDA